MKKLTTTMLAMCLAGTGCSSNKGLDVTAETVRPGDEKQLVAEFGHVVKLVYENEEAYKLVQRALFWRGRANPAKGVDLLSTSDRLDYLLGIDVEYDNSAGVEVFISEAEARQAWQSEFARARAALRLPYLQEEGKVLAGIQQVVQ
jgi:hypothetical protein